MEPPFFLLTQSRQISLSLLLRAIHVDRVHDQGGLHTHGRAVGTVNPRAKNKGAIYTWTSYRVPYNSLQILMPQHPSS